MGNSLDLLISFDDTGSMSSVRHQVRKNVNELVKDLMSKIPDLRVGVIIHNDYCDMPRHIFIQDFTQDLKVIESFVNQSSPNGGGDSPECYELALNEASKLSWKGTNKAMILIGDEVPHEVGYRYGSFQNTLNWRDECKNLKALGVQVYGVQALGRRSSDFFYKEVSNLTGGTKLDLSQFQHINTYIQAIAYHQSGGLDEFQQSDSQFKTNVSLKNMFSKLRGGSVTESSAEETELLSKFQVLDVDTDGETSIKDFVNSTGATFRKGKGYYQLISRTADGAANREKLQADKEVVFVNRSTGKAYPDTNFCREKLGIPYGEKGTILCTSDPIQKVLEEYDVFIQSNSYNRKLDPGTKFLYELDHI